MKHLIKNNETYFSHFKFAAKIGLSLTFRGIIFLLHAVLPICDIPKKWNLENTLEKLYKWNVYTNERLQK
tara:strand:+ start:457 stop:666 length:210 start_codon:yes stop_codon:yes gene_type:complete